MHGLGLNIWGWHDASDDKAMIGLYFGFINVHDNYRIHGTSSEIWSKLIITVYRWIFGFPFSVFFQDAPIVPWPNPIGPLRWGPWGPRWKSTYHYHILGVPEHPQAMSFLGSRWGGIWLIASSARSTVSGFQEISLPSRQGLPLFGHRVEFYCDIKSIYISVDGLVLLLLRIILSFLILHDTIVIYSYHSSFICSI